MTTNTPVPGLCRHCTFCHYSVFFVPRKNFAVKQSTELLPQWPHTSVRCVSWLHHFFLLGLINLVLFCTVLGLFHTAIWPRCRVGSTTVAKWQSCLRTHFSEHTPLTSGAWLYVTFWKRPSWNSKKISGCQGLRGARWSAGDFRPWNDSGWYDSGRYMSTYIC